MQHSFVFLEPGHFHAALVLKEASPRISDSIYVYARSSPETEAFTSLVDAFNRRADSPTRWKIHLRDGGLSELIAAHPGCVAVLAGQNNRKLEYLDALVGAGIAVFADKPWLTAAVQSERLDRVVTGSAPVMDIMTIRHEILSRLCHAVVHTPSVFGEFETTRGPSIELGSIHHLYKRVNGAPLRRPAWYYDPRIQGDGLVDIQSHMIEQAMWLILDEAGVTSDRAELLDATRWTTQVDTDLFEASTGLTQWPEAVAPWLDHEANVLEYPCNSVIDWRLDGITVRQQAQWRPREPEGGGDMHAVTLRGSLADVVVDQGPQTEFRANVQILPHGGHSQAVEQALPEWQRRFPGLGLEAVEGGMRFVAPARLDEGHESHFPLVRDRFLDFIETGGVPETVRSRMALRYSLLAEACQFVERGDKRT